MQGRESWGVWVSESGLGLNPGLYHLLCGLDEVLYPPSRLTCETRMGGGSERDNSGYVLSLAQHRTHEQHEQLLAIIIVIL